MKNNSMVEKLFDSNVQDFQIEVDFGRKRFDQAGLNDLAQDLRLSRITCRQNS